MKLNKSIKFFILMLLTCFANAQTTIEVNKLNEQTDLSYQVQENNATVNMSKVDELISLAKVSWVAAMNLQKQDRIILTVLGLCITSLQPMVFLFLAHHWTNPKAVKSLQERSWKKEICSFLIPMREIMSTIAESIWETGNLSIQVPVKPMGS